jgi:hypothetical protein
VVGGRETEEEDDKPILWRADAPVRTSMSNVRMLVRLNLRLIAFAAAAAAPVTGSYLEEQRGDGKR